jgi:hypothetical protein
MKTIKEFVAEAAEKMDHLARIEQIHKHLDALHSARFSESDLHRGLGTKLGEVEDRVREVSSHHHKSAYKMDKAVADAAEAKSAKANKGKSKALRLDLLTHAHSAAMVHHLNKVKDSTEEGPQYNIPGAQHWLPAKKAHIAATVRHAALNMKLDAKYDPTVAHAIRQHSSHVVKGDFKSAQQVRKGTNTAWESNGLGSNDSDYLRDLHKHAKSTKVGGTLGHFD